MLDFRFESNKTKEKREKMLKIVKSCAIAFSIYSKIPVPQFEWREEDMKYMLCFFPWIGAVIGGLLYGWYRLCGMLFVGDVAYVLIGTAIPLLITGGFHVDGFMDTMDAIHSYQAKEQKLEILKDSHIGAFACIMLALYGLVYMGAYSEVKNPIIFKMVCCVFFLSRCFSGIAVVSFPSAKKEGMLYLFANQSHKARVKRILYIQAMLGIGVMVILNGVVGSILAITACGSFRYYYTWSKKEFGGITGDTAGYFVLICECSVMVMAAVVDLLV